VASLEDLLRPAGEDRRLVGPLGFWHAAALEQLSTAAVLDNPDAAARALRASARLHGLDLMAVAPGDAVAWAVRGATMPGAPLSTVAAAQRARSPLAGLPDVEAVADSAAVGYLVALLARLRSLLSPGTLTAVVIPTAAELASSLGPEVPAPWADDALGAVLRTVGAAEPDMVLRVGEGARAGLVAGLCGFFDLALVEAVPEESPDVSAPTGEEFVGGFSPLGRLVVTRTELPADADPKAVTEAVRSMGTKVGR
jgi:hypothetical protein